MDWLLGSDLDDGQWHSVDLKSRGGHLSISVDKDDMAHSSPSFTVAIEKDLFVGGRQMYDVIVPYTRSRFECLVVEGCPGEDERQEDCRNPFASFQGCLRQLTLGRQQVDLILVQQRMLGSYSNLLIDMCGIIDRSVSNMEFSL